MTPLGAKVLLLLKLLYIVVSIKPYKYIACLLKTDKLNLGLKIDPKSGMEKWLAVMTL